MSQLKRNLCLVLGDQLNEDSLLWEAFDPKQDVILMAEVMSEAGQHSSYQRSRFFLMAMRLFAERLRSKGWQDCLYYFPLAEQMESFSEAMQRVKQTVEFATVQCVLPGDVRVLKHLEASANTLGVKVNWLADRHFIAEPGEFASWIKAYKQPRMEYWYRYLRKKHAILMMPSQSGKSDKPLGGQWNYDKDNRQAFDRSGPSDLVAVKEADYLQDPVVAQVFQDVTVDLANHLPELPGKAGEMVWPVTPTLAHQELSRFIEKKLVNFGRYQDAMWQDEDWLYHSRISAALNVKLLRPMDVVEKALQAFESHHPPIEAVEGFIRQILGWREYVRGLYWVYRDQWSEMNALQAQQSLPRFYWDANTDMNCLHQALSRVIRTGYGHHIERLMVTGLFALLYGVRPQEIEKWYLSMYVDAVAWVEVPNTLGMSQFADGGVVGSKPYIASGAYINRMSNYCKHCRYSPALSNKQPNCPITLLYWQFIDTHLNWLQSHPRLGMQAKHWLKKSELERASIRQEAEAFRQTIQLDRVKTSY